MTDPARGAGPAGPPALRITEFTDPVCPWAWGSEPAFRLLRHTLGERAVWRRVFGILFDEEDDPPPDAEAERRWYEGFVRDVAAHTSAPYPAGLRWVAGTSWPASLAARAAEAQGAGVAEGVLRRLRESMFVLGTPVDEPGNVPGVVAGVPGLDIGRLLSDAAAPRTRESVTDDFEETRRPLPEVMDLRAPGPHGGAARLHNERYRYALPTLLLEGPGGRVCVPGWRPFREYMEAARTAAASQLPAPARLSADEAQARWPSLTGPELELLTGSERPPRGAVRVATGGGPLWLRPEEARSHPAVASAE